MIAQLDHSTREEIVLGVQPTPHFAPQGIVEGVTFSPDGHYVMHRTSNSIVWVVDLASGSKRAILVSNMETARFSPDWRTLVVTNAERDQRYLKLWNMERLLPIPSEAQGPCQIETTLPTVGVRTLPYPDAPAFGFAQQGDLLTGVATSTVEGWVLVQMPQGIGWTDAWLGCQEGDCANLPVLLLPGTERLTIDTYFRARDLFFSADSELLITPIYYGLLVWDSRTGELLEHFRGDITNFNRDRTRFYSSRSQVVDLRMGAVLTNVGGYQQGAASFSADGATLAVYSRRYIALYGIPTAGRPVYQTVVGRLMGQSVALRAAPSINAPVTGTVETRDVLIVGRDSSGQYGYVSALEGWVRLGEGYITLGTIPAEALPVYTG